MLVQYSVARLHAAETFGRTSWRNRVAWVGMSRRGGRVPRGLWLRLSTLHTVAKYSYSYIEASSVWQLLELQHAAACRCYLAQRYSVYATHDGAWQCNAAWDKTLVALYTVYTYYTGQRKKTKFFESKHCEQRLDKRELLNSSLVKKRFVRRSISKVAHKTWICSYKMNAEWTISRVASDTTLQRAI